jgi:signal transduction histidine kinase/CheY-like chemotaxis protein/ligand-binding sensor domain-containing protein/HPt (histidine-containing phosphotransfer) domain-containing protein
MRHFKFILTFLVFVSCKAIFAQKYPFVLYDEDKGLFQKYIYNISQDVNNNILLSTSDGFIVFNGIDFKQINTRDSSTEKFVSTHFSSENGTIYLGYKSGVIEVYSKTGEINEIYKNRIHVPIVKIICLKDQIFIATNGSGLWVLKNGNMSRIPRISNENIWDMDSFDEKIILTGENGVEEISISENNQYSSKLHREFANESILKILHIGKAKFISVKADGGIIISDFNFKDKAIRVIQNIFDSQFKPTSICRADSTTFFLGTLGGGLIKIQFGNTLFNKYTTSHFNINNNLPSRNVQSLCVDNNGGLWIGTFGFGLSYLSTDKIKFIEDTKKRIFLSFIETNNKSLIVGTDKGIAIMDSILNFVEDPNSFAILKNDEINALYKDETGQIWIGTETSGLYLFNSKNKTLQSANTIFNISVRDVQCIAGNNDGLIFVGGYNGLFIINRNNNSTIKYTTSDGLAHNYIFDLLHDSKGNLWIVSPQSGLQKFRDGKFQLFNNIAGLESFNITSICESFNRIIWFSTEGDGVFSYNGKRFYHYTTKNGLASNFCYGITCNLQNQIFVKHKNLISTKPNSKTAFSIFNTQKLNNEFTNKSIYTTGNNSTLLGSLGGVMVIKRMPLNEITPQLYIKEIIVNGNISDRNTLQSLSYNENEIRINFNGIYYSSPEKLNYRYKLIGYDSIWRYLSYKDNSVFFKQLPPGNYTFLIQAVIDEENTSNIYEVKFIIQQPFWNKWWFYLLVFLFIVASTMLYVRVRNKNILEENLYLEKLVSQRTAELRQKNEQVAGMLKSKELFFANINHEIRTPFNAVIGFSELLLETKLSPQQIDYVKTIHTSADGLIRLINDLLELSRMEAGKISFSSKPFKILTVIEEVEKTISLKALENKVSLVNVLDKAIPEVLIGDAFRFKQILLNLVSNAVKFTKNGKVSIAVQLIKIAESEILLEVKVTDQGIGMEEKRLDKIFESFTQANSAISANYGGTGLGLSITKNILQQLGGNISVESKLGFGSTFKCIIPFKKYGVRDVINVDLSIPEDVTVNRTLGLKVLLADDLLVNRVLIEKWLTKWDCEVEGFANGADLIAKLKTSNTNYDVILLDLQMPVLDGYETAKKIREELLIETPIVAITGSTSGEIIEKCYSFGMNGYITKPFRSSELFNAINNVCNKKTEYKGSNEYGTSSSNKGFSLKYLNEEYKDDHDFLKQMISLMLLTCDKFIVQLNNLIISNNKSEIKKLIHKIRPTLEMLSLREVSEIVFKIESICNDINAKSDLNGLYENLESKYYDLKPKIIIEAGL